MQLADLSPAIIEKIKTFRYDRMIEKHEGPESWSSILAYYAPEFMLINGYDVLLPLEGERHPNITVLRCVVSSDEKTLTLFLKDTTYNPDPALEHFYVGRVAICDRVEGAEFFIAVFYHEWFIVKNERLP